MTSIEWTGKAERLIEERLLRGHVKVRARNHDYAGEPYRPSSGTEGMAFDELWCSRCARDAAFREDMDGKDGCKILAATFAYKITDPNYPKEWVYDSDGRPKCTAFTEIPDAPLRCENTLDLFELDPANRASAF